MVLGMLALPGNKVIAAGNIDPENKWAWGSNVGWINFNPDNGGVAVYSDHLEGYAWGENVGWIRLGTCSESYPCNHANTSTSNYGVNNDGDGNLSGYAWSTTTGWINFDPEGNERVTIDPLTGDFSGYAWGENIGWIHFQNSDPAYKVNTSWRPPSSDGNIDLSNKWAWSANAGWINFNPDYGSVTVYSDHLEGFAWGENIGWIHLGTCTGGSPCNHANTSNSDYGVNNDHTGNLSGYAWSTTTGWINFDPEGNERVTIDPLTGDFSGYAWGENIGWIHFENAEPAYKVNTTWRPNPPVANAGLDQEVKVLSLVSLDGNASFDPDGNIPLTYLWTQTGGSSVTLSDDQVVNPTFIAPDDETILTFSLAVTNNLGIPSLSSDEVVISVDKYSIYLPMIMK